MAMKEILNLTQHDATPEQIADGVYDLPNDMKQRVKALLTFNDIPLKNEIFSRTDRLISIINAVTGGKKTKVMIGGAPFLMPILQSELHMAGHTPMYAFSSREVKSETMQDGSVEKTTVFRHTGFFVP